MCVCVCVCIYIYIYAETAKCIKPAKYFDTPYNVTYLCIKSSRIGTGKNVFCQVRIGSAAGSVRWDASCKYGIEIEIFLIINSIVKIKGIEIGVRI